MHQVSSQGDKYHPVSLCMPLPCTLSLESLPCFSYNHKDSSLSNGSAKWETCSASPQKDRLKAIYGGTRHEIPTACMLTT